MGTTRTADEALAHYTQEMGETLGTVYHHLWQELARLFAEWNEYVTLYGTKSSRVDLLNNAAPYFFRVVQDSLWEDTILHIARMTDPSKTGKKENLTVQQLPELVDDPALFQKLNLLIDKAKVASEFCRDWRNRKLAHRDLGLAVGSTAVELTPGSREKVEAALQALADIMDSVSTHYLESTTIFDMGANFGGAESLLRILDEGINAEEERRERIAQGNGALADFRRPEL